MFNTFRWKQYVNEHINTLERLPDEAIVANCCNLFDCDELDIKHDREFIINYVRNVQNAKELDHLKALTDQVDWHYSRLNSSLEQERNVNKTFYTEVLIDLFASWYAWLFKEDVDISFNSTNSTINLPCVRLPEITLEKIADELAHEVVVTRIIPELMKPDSFNIFKTAMKCINLCDNYFVGDKDIKNLSNILDLFTKFLSPDEKIEYLESVVERQQTIIDTLNKELNNQ